MRSAARQFFLLYGKEVIYFMPKDLNTRTKVVHYVCAALLLVLLVMQFTPFWHKN